MRNIIITIVMLAAMFFTLTTNAQTTNLDKFNKIYVETPCKIELCESDSTYIRISKFAKDYIYYEIIDNVMKIKQINMNDNIEKDLETLPVIRIYIDKTINIATTRDLYMVDNTSKIVSNRCNELTI